MAFDEYMIFVIDDTKVHIKNNYHEVIRKDSSQIRQHNSDHEHEELMIIPAIL
ncbi:hypothetical protein Pint_14222 [Pistacia integerrima]|uniref:Uncharacterized protein n=1 Tax=Pistacia integerrima TaxID=434235 RepID=A0ACC0Y9D0_9ROSI|nr:hypothetical protein Pint_14222 [Pistacia integerrima]